MKCCGLVSVSFEVSRSFKFVPKHYFSGFIRHYCFRARPNLGIHTVIWRTSESGDLLLCEFISNNNAGRKAGSVAGRSALLKRMQRDPLLTAKLTQPTVRAEPPGLQTEIYIKPAPLKSKTVGRSTVNSGL